MVGQLVATAVAAHLPPAPGPPDSITSSDIEWEALDPALQPLVNSITIWRTSTPMDGAWTSLVAGKPYTDPGDVEHLLKNKAAKLAAYATTGAPTGC